MSIPTEKPASDPPTGIPAVDTEDRSIVRRLWDVFRREPMLLVTFSYLFVSIVGLFDSYWFYRRFDIQILEYMQSSDYFVSGLRRPEYLLMLVATFLAGAAALLPERWRQRHPERAARLQSRWWGRLLVPRRSDWWAYFGLHPETVATLVGLCVVVTLLFSHSNFRATDIQRGHPGGIEVRLSGAARILDGDWRMLGTSSAFVFLWNLDERRAEVVPIESVASIRPGIRNPRVQVPDAATDGAEEAENAPVPPTQGGSATPQ